MRIRIHRGTKEIGGTCIEIEAQGKRVVLDVGLPLDAPDDPDADAYDSLLPRVPGFREPDDGLLGVVISHSHPDHYGLARNIRPEIPVHIGEAAHNILKAARPFVPKGYAFADPHFLHHRTPVEIGPFRITPHLVDPSAFDAYALLVEADGRRVYYSGDFRAHGRKASLIEAAIREPPRDIDVLLMEGTTIGRTGTREGFASEAELEEQFVQAFDETGGLHFLWTSVQNIDRVVTIFRAARRTGRALLIDLYAALVLEATGRPTIPQSHWDGVKLYVPHRPRVLIKNNRMFEDLRRHETHRVYPEKPPGLGGRAVMLFRTGTMYDRGLRAALDDARLTYSMWEGYLEEESTRRVTSGWRRGASPGRCSTLPATPRWPTCSASPPLSPPAGWCRSTPSRRRVSPSFSIMWIGGRRGRGGRCEGGRGGGRALAGSAARVADIALYGQGGQQQSPTSGRRGEWRIHP